MAAVRVLLLTLGLSAVLVWGGCSETFSELNGSIVSPGRASRGRGGKQCTYEIDTGYPVIMACTGTKLPCELSGLRLLDDNSGDLMKFCGEAGRQDFVSTGKVTATFNTKWHAKEKFNCTYESITF